MPTIVVKRSSLFKAIGINISDEEFENVCFDFGLEIEKTNEKKMIEDEQGVQNDRVLSTEPLYKIEVPANRPDLLSLEGIVLALGTFLEKSKFPTYRPLNHLPEEERKLICEKSVAEVRPYGFSAILRGIEFDDEKLKTFMDLQDKLHNNFGRGRKLVSMGTHDLDTVKGPFYYRGMKPEEMNFVPLNRTEAVNGYGMIDMLKSDPKLSKYLYLLDNCPVFPAMVDSNGVIMSVPPIINSQHTKMTINTKNVLLDITGTDKTRCEVVLNILVALFSMYCSKPFTVEEILVVTDEGSKVYPDLKPRIFEADVEYLKKISGVPKELSNEDIIRYLRRMELETKELTPTKLLISCPITRSDILHPCDIAEDLSISYGYNNIAKKSVTTQSFGKQQPYNKLSDLFRAEMSMGGYVEYLTMALISIKDQFTNLLMEPSEDTVLLGYSACKEFETVRRSLIPCILKVIAANKTTALPLNVFELSDIVVCDNIYDTQKFNESDNNIISSNENINNNKSAEVGARNVRKLCFAYENISSNMEVVQGMVDRLMKKVGLSYKDQNPKKRYKYIPSNEVYLFPDRQANIEIFEGKKIGVFGIVHPKVLKNFGILNPVTICEIDIQYIFDCILNGELLEGFV